MDKEDRKTLEDTVNLIWKKGANHPNEAVLYFNFTKLIEKLLTETPPAEVPAPEKPQLELV